MTRGHAVCIALVIALWGGDPIGNAAQAQQQHRSPIQRVDHIMIRTDRPAEIYALFTDILRLPVAWPLAERGGVVSGGAGFGNVIVEAITFPGQVSTPAATHLVGFGFKPTALSESLAELTRRRITHGEPRPFVSTTPDGVRMTFFTNVTLLQFSDSDRPGNATTHIFLSEYEPAYVDVDRRRARLRRELEATSGGTLGVTGVKEIILGATNPSTAARLWQSLLHPTHTSLPGGLWQIGDGPGVRLVQANDNLVQGLVITVKSLSRATEVLQQLGLLGAASATEATFASAKIHGLNIRLVQDNDSMPKESMLPPSERRVRLPAAGLSGPERAAERR